MLQQISAEQLFLSCFLFYITKIATSTNFRYTPAFWGSVIHTLPVFLFLFCKHLWVPAGSRKACTLKFLPTSLLTLVKCPGCLWSTTTMPRAADWQITSSSLTHGTQHLWIRPSNVLLQRAAGNLVEVHSKSPCKEKSCNILPLPPWFVLSPVTRLDMCSWKQVMLLHHTLERKLCEKSGGCVPPCIHGLQNITK